MGDITLASMYRRAYEREVVPYPFQRVAAEKPRIDILIASIGLGKTAAVTLGWAWRRLTVPDATPRRLVWCLPMRTLVEQTARDAETWMYTLEGLFTDASRKPSVHAVMGGAVDGDWRLRPRIPPSSSARRTCCSHAP